VHNITRTRALTPKADTLATNQPQRAPLAITYNPALRFVSSILTNTSTFCRHLPVALPFLIKAKPFVVFRRSNNLNNKLASAKLHTVTTANELRGFFSCGNNCLTCSDINDGLTKYTFNSTGETRFINHRIDCNSKNVVYMIQPLSQAITRKVDLKTASMNITDLLTKKLRLQLQAHHSIRTFFV